MPPAVMMISGNSLNMYTFYQDPKQGIKRDHKVYKIKSKSDKDGIPGTVITQGYRIRFKRDKNGQLVKNIRKTSAALKADADAELKNKLVNQKKNAKAFADQKKAEK